jgi:ABC-2 type transport system ATP-binding protein
MIHTDGLARTFTTGTGKGKQTVEAVRGIDLHVAEGELVAMLGPNGAGKSTTLRMLTTLLPPSRGRATVAGVDVTTDPAEVRRRIGYIGQNPGAGFSYRVWDELLQQGRFYGLERDEATRRAREVVASLHLDGLEMRKVQTLSGGQKRRLDIALGLIHSPGLLFLDEPSTGMDPQNRANLWEHILRLREEHGTTIVLTTHYLEEADTMAERVVIVDHGRIIADDTAAALKAEQAGDRIGLTVAPGDLATAAEVAARVGEVVSAEGERVTVRVEHGDRLLPGLLTALADRRADVRAATLHQPTLDDVFLTLTGRSLREGADAA